MKRKELHTLRAGKRLGFLEQLIGAGYKTSGGFFAGAQNDGNMNSLLITAILSTEH